MPVETVPAPLRLTGEVREEWIDYNGHLTDACFGLAFDASTMAMLNLLDVGPEYLERTGATVFTAECHLRFLRQVLAGDELRFSSQLLGYDDKRIHVHHTLAAGASDLPAATSEQLFLHVDHGSGRVAPLPPAALARLEEVRRAHAALAVPDTVGRGIRLGPRQGRPADGSGKPAKEGKE